VLKAQELGLIALTALVVTVVISLVTLLVLCAARRAGVATKHTIVLAGALGSIVLSTVVLSAEMYISAHDLNVLVWVIGVSALTSMVAGWLVTRRAIRASIATLVGDTRRVGDGDVIDPASTGWMELDAVSAELAETSERLAEARARVSELDVARRNFFAWISHDLRTPLAGMRAMAEALEAGTAPDPEAYIRLIRTKVDTVNHMVDDLFQLSKLQTGTLELHPERVVLLDLISDAVADVQIIAAARGITVVRDGIDGHMIWADPREITRAVGNLLSNSIRHAPADSTIVIRADLIDDECVVVSIIDQGPGVTAENLGRMFDVGWRADASRSTDFHLGSSAGAGFGLAIVRGIVEAHGGTIRAGHSSEGFHLDLLLPTAGASGSFADQFG
jgi:signal transduction histidine kinase